MVHLLLAAKGGGGATTIGLLPDMAMRPPYRASIVKQSRQPVAAPGNNVSGAIRA